MFPAFNLPDLVRMYATIFGGVDNIKEPVTLYEHTFWPKYVVDAATLYPFDVIGQYEGTVLIMHGDKDELVPLSTSEQAVEKYKDATLIVLEDQKHGFDEAGTEIAVGYLEEFLSQQLSSTE